MADSFISSHTTAPLPATSPKPLQRELLESARQLSAEASQFAYEWQGAWPDQAAAGDLDACVEAMRMGIDRLVAELGRDEGPAETEVAGLIGALLGTTTEPGPFRHIQALTQGDGSGASAEQQKLLSEVEVLRIQFNALRTEWQDYLSVMTALYHASGPHPVLQSPRPAAEEGEFVPVDGSGAPPVFAPLSPVGGATPRRQTTDAFLLVPKRRRWRMSEHTRRELRETLTICATLGGVLLVLMSLGYLAVTHLPQEQKPFAATPAPTRTSPPASSAPNPTWTSQPFPTATLSMPPTATLAPQPTATMPASTGLAQLTVNPPVLLVPCPGAGAGTLQLVNTSTQLLHWTARTSSLSGGNPGIALDVAQGSLEADGVAFINVTALAEGAQGSITIVYNSAASPATVTYTVSC
ncbi:MAG TPA: hypothetical protein VH540_13660 [Ktedonobacterales bacterium]|jgi:hypothetical protein